MLLALHCFSLSDYAAIGIDTALEQLDPDNRDSALAYLSQGAAHGFAAALIDNRLDCPPGWSPRELAARVPAFACDLAAAIGRLGRARRRRSRCAICRSAIRGGRDIFRNARPQARARPAPTASPGRTAPARPRCSSCSPAFWPRRRARITLDGTPYAPWRSGNRIFALATQNPDHQWCGATLAEDLARRRAALARYPASFCRPTTALAALAACLGIRSLDQHLYELPLVARKRLSWLWPLAGAMPWVMLDEPTLGQDQATRAALADAIGRLARLGYGVVFITHDDEFASLIAHRPLRLSDGTVMS